MDWRLVTAAGLSSLWFPISFRPDLVGPSLPLEGLEPVPGGIGEFHQEDVPELHDVADGLHRPLPQGIDESADVRHLEGWHVPGGGMAGAKQGDVRIRFARLEFDEVLVVLLEVNWQAQDCDDPDRAANCRPSRRGPGVFALLLPLTWGDLRRGTAPG